MRKADLPDLSDLAQPGAEIRVRVTPRSRRPGVVVTEDRIEVRVTAVPEDGRANAAVAQALARAMGVAPGRLSLIRGGTARDKVFRLD